MANNNHGVIEAFVINGGESYDEWKERLEFYFIANGVEEAAKKKAILLSNIGKEAYHLIRNLCAPGSPTTKTYRFQIYFSSNITCMAGEAPLGKALQ